MLWLSPKSCDLTNLLVCSTFFKLLKITPKWVPMGAIGAWGPRGTPKGLISQFGRRPQLMLHFLFWCFIHCRWAYHPGAILSPSWYQDVFNIKNMRIIIFKKPLKIWFLKYFGGVPGVATSKKYIGALILTIFQIFEKSSVLKYFVFFLLSNYISAYPAITIARALKKDAY